MVAHCWLKGLELWGGSTLLPILNGVKDNCSITHLDVTGEPITIWNVPDKIAWLLLSECTVLAHFRETSQTAVAKDN